MVSPLPDLAFAGERELEKVKIGDYRGGDHHARAPIQRIEGDGAQLGLAVTKVEEALARQVGEAVFGEDAAHMLARLIQITGAENGLTGPRITIPLFGVALTAVGETLMAASMRNNPGQAIYTRSG